LARDRRRQSGFTLLEVEAAVLILSILVVGVFKLVWHHEQIADASDQWCQINPPSFTAPTYYIQISGDELERVLGMPGELVDTSPPALPGPPAPDVYDVEVQDYSQALYPPTSTCSVVMTLNP
jgi:prepilin-type N-terminal cleavage/methylation domain-containing protein